MCHFVLRFDDHGGQAAFTGQYREEMVELEPFVRDELLQIDNAEIRVTQRGRLFVRNICMVFDAYLQKADRTKPMFSRTV